MRNRFIKSAKSLLVCTAVLCTAIFTTSCGGTSTAGKGEGSLVSGMTLDEKLSQMIIPAIRTWDETEVTDLDAVPKLKEALKKHQYGGIILFGQNIKDTEQTVELVSELQANNLENENASVHIPYLMPVDEEGGVVIRVSDGTRMTGNMAIGATGDAAEENALTTGRIIGEELLALGFNADFAPVVDVNNNAGNPVIGVRSFSDDPKTVAALGKSYMDGLSGEDIVACCKHFPGHGDTSVDSHIGTPSVDKTYEELQKTELVPFEAMIKNGVDMVMTAHITFPKIDDNVTFSDGSKGYYPATMSPKIITDILRGDLGYNNVVVTDADSIFVLGRVETDRTLVESTMARLKDEGAISPEAKVTYDYYIEPDPEGEKLHYTDEMAEGIRNADVVIAMTQTSNTAMLADSAPMYQAVSRAAGDVHAGGGSFVLLSCRLPYDAARFLDADAIVLAYLGAGMDTDPTAAGGDQGRTGAYNANAVAALEIITGKAKASGSLPVNIPKITLNDDGTVSYSDELLYERGAGLN